MSSLRRNAYREGRRMHKGGKRFEIVRNRGPATKSAAFFCKSIGSYSGSPLIMVCRCLVSAKKRAVVLTHAESASSNAKS